MSLQFAAIPIRATADTRLGGPDHRLLGTIARYDRFGRNGAGCYVNGRKLAQEAGINYKHLGRQTQRLEAFGYITTEPSQTDKRRKIYSVLYDEAEIVTCGGDNPGADAAECANFSPLAKKVTTGGDNRPEKVTKPKSQPVVPSPKSPPKRLSKAYLRDPAKPQTRHGERRPHRGTVEPTKVARQRNRGGGSSRAQGHMMVPIQGGNQKPTTQQREIDWMGWRDWRVSTFGETNEEALNFIGAALDTIKKERGVDIAEAGAILDREFKRRRKTAA